MIGLKPFCDFAPMHEPNMFESNYDRIETERIEYQLAQNNEV